MATRYRLTRIDPSNNPEGVKDSRNQTFARSYPQQEAYDVQPTVMTKSSSNHIGLWIALGFVALLLIVGGAMWMTHVSGQLAGISQTTQQNANNIQQAKGLLMSIQAEVHTINIQITQLSQQITTMFGDLMQAIHNAHF